MSRAQSWKGSVIGNDDKVRVGHDETGHVSDSTASTILKYSIFYSEASRKVGAGTGNLQKSYT